jgi:type I restriction enzyme S subunit
MYGANEAAIDANLSNPRFIRITDIQDDGNLRSDTFCSLAEEVAAPYLLRAGDILLARTGELLARFYLRYGLGTLLLRWILD